MMFRKLRKIPAVYLFISLFRLLMGRLRYSKHYLEKSVKMKDGQVFTIFRHITAYPLNQRASGCVFIVSFKFARLSHKVNKIVSVLPMLLITGVPGFVAKCYAVDHNSGYWQGMYQWKSMKHLEEYKKSFVFKMMNKRAIKETIKSIELNNQILTDFIEDNTVNN